MKVNLHTPVEEVQIQIIPLIDVVFCILTFFLLAALQFTRQQAINVDLPKAATGTPANLTGQSSTQIVTIDAVGNTYIEKQPVKREELAQRLQQYLQQNPNGILVLNASRTATYNDVVETLDLLRQVGGDRVSLGIIPGPTQPSVSQPNLPTEPYIPTNPGVPPAPVPGINPQGNFDPNIPVNPNQIPPTGEGVIPGVPNAPATQFPVAPGNTNSAPKR
ncbi:biopolymer transport protein ExbD/TolR [Nostoc sp. HK-01]|uniref:Biopolymer transport protein ExbD/TolR n=1 Tax=Nostoc cycadae WK-1 TaxID=1861711 RepID=A0A2H6LEV7_9NOSO|nr:biopolymer transporter ExbD [Nostoc cycadae]BBD60948.1 biopolymer transport protein ExbD/TolR [Nostoc sp. HK-01]GBE91666.1 biopolymer transport protein ExbD/TolR [Nostoc cycadae WK-1]